MYYTYKYYKYYDRKYLDRKYSLPINKLEILITKINGKYFILKVS